MHEPMRILIVGPAPAGPNSRGGMATVMKLMLDHPDRRFAVRSVPTFVDGTVLQRARAGIAGMTVSALLVLLGRVDVLHVHLSHGGSVVRKSVPMLAARIRRVPVVVHAHSYGFADWMDRLPALARPLVRQALPADRWLVLGTSLSTEYARSLNLSPSQVQVLYNPVALPEVSTRTAGRDRVVIVSLGRLGRRKGSYDLVEAIRLLEPELRNRVRVVAAGDGEVTDVRDAVSKAGVDDTITVLDWLAPTERDELLRSADIFALPSYEEGLPMAMLEAMGMGLVPVTTPVGGIPEVVTDGEHGILVAPGDSRNLSDAIAVLVGDEVLRARMATAARRRAEDFDISTWYDALATVWTDLMRRRRR